MREQPLVTAIITTYKRSEFLIRALESVFNQSYKHLEIIVVDDNNGNDEFRIATRQSLSQFIADGKITYIEHQLNKGMSAARNTGIRAAKGEFVAFLDDDDEWMPQKIEIQTGLFENLNEEYALVYGSYNMIYVDSGEHKIVRPRYEGDVENIVGLNHIGPPSMIMCRRNALVELEGFDENLRSSEDAEMYIRLASNYKIAFSNKILLKYYVHSNSVSRMHKEKLKCMKLLVEKHKTKLLKPSYRWSEINERLGELYAINGEMKEAQRAFMISYLNKPQRPQVLGKFIFSLLGYSLYTKVANDL